MMILFAVVTWHLLTSGVHIQTMIVLAWMVRISALVPTVLTHPNDDCALQRIQRLLLKISSSWRAMQQAVGKGAVAFPAVVHRPLTVAAVNFVL